MSKCRFIYLNLITSEAMLSVSSLRPGIVTLAKKEGIGSAIITPSGVFSGAVDLEYIVEIDTIGTGAIGSSTFQWSDGGGLNASGVTTSATNILLNNGVYIKWTGGAAPHFVIWDKWYFKGINLFNAGKTIDLNRDHGYRSAKLDSNILETEGLLYLTKEAGDRILTEAG